jgi:hypothetical protein
LFTLLFTPLNNPTAIWLLISEVCDAVSRC